MAPDFIERLKALA